MKTVRFENIRFAIKNIQKLAVKFTKIQLKCQKKIHVKHCIVNKIFNFSNLSTKQKIFLNRKYIQVFSLRIRIHRLPIKI